MEKLTVKNYPSSRLMETIGATNLSPAEAIGELVANCFDARCGDEKLNIEIWMKNRRITVVDNGKGMVLKVLEKAICIAEDMSLHIDRGEGAKGHFGMGFKTSCSTLGRNYEIFTRPVNEAYECHTSFDISEYANRKSGANSWDVDIEIERPRFSTSPLGSRSHGTAFVISDLRVDSIPCSAVLDYLGQAFKFHLLQGDKIVIVDERERHEAVPKGYDYVEGSKIEINETFGPNNKYHISGWMALDKQLHNDTFYGFNVYRHGQLVLTYDKSWFRAHLMTSRIVGEVNMDFLDATFYKQGVQQSEDWTIVTSHMKEFLKPIVSASGNISKKGNVHNPVESKKIINKLNKDYKVEVEDSGSGTSKGGDKKTNENPEQATSKISDTIKEIVSEDSLTLEDEMVVNITYLVKESGFNMKSPFDYIFAESEEEETAELQVILFSDHPLWNKKCDEEVKKIIATSDAVYRVLVEKLGYDTSKALKIRNTWLLNRMEGGNK